MQNGILKLTYDIALSSGKSVEKKDIKISQRGQFSTSSSRITLSPKTLTSMAPLDLSTRRVRISLIALLLALMSMAQTPRTTNFSRGSAFLESIESRVKARSEHEPVDEGEEDLVKIELDRGEDELR